MREAACVSRSERGLEKSNSRFRKPEDIIKVLGRHRSRQGHTNQTSTKNAQIRGDPEKGVVADQDCAIPFSSARCHEVLGDILRGLTQFAIAVIFVNKPKRSPVGRLAIEQELRDVGF
jgi:hypothetical protein